MIEDQTHALGLCTKILTERAALVITLWCALILVLAPPVLAQDLPATDSEQSDPIELSVAQTETVAAAALDREQLDALITQRLSAVYAEIDGFDAITVSSQSGVVTLAGDAANGEVAAEATALAERVEGVILVRDQIERLRDLEGNLSPALSGLSDSVDELIVSLPLMAVAFGLFLTIAFLGHALARWSALWQRLLPNTFLAELVSQAVRIVAIFAGLVVALNLVGATAFMGTILGGAGVIGIAVGFAVRDTLENYVSSIMLSLRQPFRADDHVVIGEHEGYVIRLTSRATILMTLDGNHLRIPNADVFKGVILNYTRNPHRRFDFALGVDAEDDPAAGMETGLAAMRDLPFLLSDQEPFAAIEEVGDSSIILRFYAWVDQTEADFLKARSLSIRAAKDALEATGFTLPEPIYRLRFDPATVNTATLSAEGVSKGAQDKPPSQPQHPSPEPTSPSSDASQADVKPDKRITDAIASERAAGDDEDLLDSSQPVE